MTVTARPVVIVPTYRNNARLSMTPWASAGLSQDAYEFLDAMCRRHNVTLYLDSKSAQGPFRAMLYNPETQVTITKWDRRQPGEAALAAFKAHAETK